MEYALIRSKRRTLAIYITREGTVEVRAPLKMPKAEIEKFVHSKETWIFKHCANRMQENQRKEAFSVQYQYRPWLRGRACDILPREGEKAYFDGEAFILPPNLKKEEMKVILIALYKELAKAYLSERVRYFAEIAGVTPESVKINGAKGRWGSCSGKNRLNFSWRLLLAEEKSIDYVVVHELMHIREHNHSQRFWAEVARILPDYEERKKGLKCIQEKLAGENWEVDA